MNVVQNIYRGSEIFFTSIDQKPECDPGFACHIRDVCPV